jgi:HK97 family phage prohead protease
LTGYAAVFNQATNIGPYDETVSPHAFDEGLSESPDVVALFDHGGQPLGRTGNGTLKLSVDSYGLRYEVTPPDTSVGRDVMELVKRGDISASSFAFSLRGDNGDSWQYGGPLPHRMLQNLNLHDVSPVTTPAYANTSVAARSKEFLPKVEGICTRTDEYEKWIQEAYARNNDIRVLRFGLK